MSETLLNESINEINEYKKQLRKLAEESPDVKAGKCTVEDELKEPAYVLYNQIAASSIKILELPAVIKTFGKLSESLGEDVTQSIVELFALTMIQSSHQAVLFYDELLKAELIKQFDNLGEHMNDTSAKVQGITGAIDVFKKQLNDIQTKMKIDSFTKENDISPPPGE